MRFTTTILTGSCLALVAATAGFAEDVTYGYDPLGRLVAVARSGGSNLATSYHYDPAGNRVLSSVGTGTIPPPPPPPPPAPPSFGVSDATANEGDALSFTVSRSGSSAGGYTVDYSTGGLSAGSGADFTAATGTLTFLAGETVKTVTVATIEDSLSEASETLQLNLVMASGGASFTDAQAIGTIVDDEPPNQPPVANPNSANVGICATVYVNVVGNDTDPENQTLELVAVGTPSPELGEARVDTTTHVEFTAFGDLGDTTVTYTVRDPHGATATGYLNIHIVNGTGCL